MSRRDPLTIAVLMSDQAPLMSDQAPLMSDQASLFETSDRHHRLRRRLRQRHRPAPPRILGVALQTYRDTFHARTA
ncbi:hypothetical protein [Microbispora sp. NPDC046933]|uniref:hypothetical protein n=1 Tax=Microbispora sp. NPDC046933 TaxID=3155618 RepID=UPI0033D33119